MPRNIYTFDPLIIEAGRKMVKDRVGQKTKKNFMLTFKNTVYNWIPATKLKYETFSSPSWEYDVQPGPLYRELADVYQDEVKEAIINFLKHPTTIDISKTDQIKVILNFLGSDQTYTQTEVATKLGVSKALVSRIKSQM